MRTIEKEEIESIIQLDIINFIKEAYKVVLGRTADIEGVKSHLIQYIKGLSKEELIISLFESDEAKQKEVAPSREWLEDFAHKQKKMKRVKNVEDKKVENHEDLLLSLAEILFTSDKAEAFLGLEQEEEEKTNYYKIDYFDFENNFRGSREKIKELQQIYVPYFENCKNVLDLGCGRGEFTELMVDNNIGVTGIDLYLPYVEYNKRLGLPVEFGDAIEYLREAPSVDGIFMGQVIEHLSIEQIIEILHLAKKKLEPGKYLIMETPNPMSLAIYTHAFYMDPSHQKPVHPLTLRYLAKKAGFNDIQILYTESSKAPHKIPKINEADPDYMEFNNAMQTVSDQLFGSQDYALIARQN